MPIPSPLVSFFNQYSKALLIAAQDGNLVYANRAFSDLTGFDSDSLNRRNLVELCSPPLTEESSAPFREAALTTQKGSKIYLRVSVSEFSLPNVQPLKIYTFDDYCTEQEYKEENSQLTKKIEQLTEELERFTYVTSHDLQAPLRMIGSYIQLIQKSIDKGEGEKAREFMVFVQDGISNLHALTDGLLQFSRINRRGTPFTAVDTNESVRAAMALLSDKIRKTGARITFDKLPVVKGDSAQLKQLFLNIIDNALKFSVPQQELLITISVIENENDYLFLIKDNGIGIDSKYFERIFLIFQRLHSRLEYEGTGTGLAVGKKIVENHEGKIWVESELGLGSSFFFTIKK